MEKSDSRNCEYIIFVKYENVEDLNNTIYEIFSEIENEADIKNCFTEGDPKCD